MFVFVCVVCVCLCCFVLHFAQTNQTNTNKHKQTQTNTNNTNKHKQHKQTQTTQTNTNMADKRQGRHPKQSGKQPRNQQPARQEEEQDQQEEQEDQKHELHSLQGALPFGTRVVRVGPTERDESDSVLRMLQVPNFPSDIFFIRALQTNLRNRFEERYKELVNELRTHINPQEQPEYVNVQLNIARFVAFCEIYAPSKAVPYLDPRIASLASALMIDGRFLNQVEKISRLFRSVLEIFFQYCNFEDFSRFLQREFIQYATAVHLELEAFCEMQRQQEPSLFEKVINILSGVERLLERFYSVKESLKRIANATPAALPDVSGEKDQSENKQAKQN